MKSWNEEINKTLALAGVTFEQVPQTPAEIKVPFLDGFRQIFRVKNYLYVTGQDKYGRCTTHFVDRDTWSRT